MASVLTYTSIGSGHMLSVDNAKVNRSKRYRTDVIPDVSQFVRHFQLVNFDQVRGVHWQIDLVIV